MALEVSRSGDGGGVRLSDLHQRIRTGEERDAAIDEEVQAVGRGQNCEDEIEQALADFAPIWDALSPCEQARIVQLLVERVDYDGAAQTVSITFHPSWIKALADEIAGPKKGKRA